MLGNFVIKWLNTGNVRNNQLYRVLQLLTFYDICSKEEGLLKSDDNLCREIWHIDEEYGKAFWDNTVTITCIFIFH